MYRSTLRFSVTARLVTVRRNGLNVYYKIADPKIVESCRILHDLWKNKSL